MEDIKQFILENNPEIKMPEDLDVALIGYAERISEDMYALYDAAKIPEKTKNKRSWCVLHKMSLEEIFDTHKTKEFLIAEEYNNAVLGYAEVDKVKVIVYDADKCIDILAAEMPYEDASEYFYYNVAGGWVGKQTPIFAYLNENIEF